MFSLEERHALHFLVYTLCYCQTFQPGSERGWFVWALPQWCLRMTCRLSACQRKLSPLQGTWGWKTHLIVAGPTPSHSDHPLTSKASAPTLPCTSSCPHILPAALSWVLFPGAAVWSEVRGQVGPMTGGGSPCSCSAICRARQPGWSPLPHSTACTSPHLIFSQGK